MKSGYYGRGIPANVSTVLAAIILALFALGVGSCIAFVWSVSSELEHVQGGRGR